MNHFNDENSLDDILGCLYCAKIDVTKEKPEFDPEDQIKELVSRIETKIQASKNATKKAWFHEALKKANVALNEFKLGNPVMAESLLDSCEEKLVKGNKAQKRKTDFIVGTKGETSKNS